MKKANMIIHEHPDSPQQATHPIDAIGEEAVETMRNLACKFDSSGIVFDRRIELGQATCDMILTAKGHSFTTNHFVRLADIQG